MTSNEEYVAHLEASVTVKCLIEKLRSVGDHYYASGTHDANLIGDAFHRLADELERP